MPSAFINYRREETSGYAGRLYGDLKETLGQDRVFMDLNIEPGEDFTEVINDRVASCDVQLVIIGKQWARLKDDADQRRIDNPDDFVRLEIGAALKRQIRVIPILVQGATLPKRDQLPDDLKGLVSRQAFEISDSRWDHDVAQLSEVVTKIFASQAAGTKAKSPAPQTAPSPPVTHQAAQVRTQPVDPEPVREVSRISSAAATAAPLRAAPLESPVEPGTTTRADPAYANLGRLHVAAAVATIAVFWFVFYVVAENWRPVDAIASTAVVVVVAAALFCSPLFLVSGPFEARITTAALWAGITVTVANLLATYFYTTYDFGVFNVGAAGVLSYLLFAAAAYFLVINRRRA